MVMTKFCNIIYPFIVQTPCVTRLIIISKKCDYKVQSNSCFLLYIYYIYI